MKKLCLVRSRPLVIILRGATRAMLARGSIERGWLVVSSVEDSRSARVIIMPLLVTLRTTNSGCCRLGVCASNEYVLHGFELVAGLLRQCLAHVALHRCYLAIGVFVIVVRNILG